MKTPEEIERSWSERGYSCEHRVDPPGETWENVVHNEDELFMLLEGEVELQTAGIVQLPEPGEEVPLPAHTLHTVRVIGQTPARWIYGMRGRENS
jgi:mannose-6-phosphate isomerase-like protein (cupin superfamily)